MRSSPSNKVRKDFGNEMAPVRGCRFITLRLCDSRRWRHFSMPRNPWRYTHARLCAFPGADPGFWSGVPSRVLTPEGALSLKFAQNRGFPLKLSKNCMILNKSWGQGEDRVPSPPGSASEFPYASVIVLKRLFPQSVSTCAALCHDMKNGSNLAQKFLAEFCCAFT